MDSDIKCSLQTSSVRLARTVLLEFLAWQESTHHQESLARAELMVFELAFAEPIRENVLHVHKDREDHLGLTVRRDTQVVTASTATKATMEEMEHRAMRALVERKELREYQAQTGYLGHLEIPDTVGKANLALKGFLEFEAITECKVFQE